MGSHTSISLRAIRREACARASGSSIDWSKKTGARKFNVNESAFHANRSNALVELTSKIAPREDHEAAWADEAQEVGGVIFMAPTGCDGSFATRRTAPSISGGAHDGAATPAHRGATA